MNTHQCKKANVQFVTKNRSVESSLIQNNVNKVVRHTERISYSGLSNAELIKIYENKLIKLKSLINKDSLTNYFNDDIHQTIEEKINLLDEILSCPICRNLWNNEL